MVFLSGKRERKSKLIRLIDPCLTHQIEHIHEKLLYGNYKDPLSSKVAQMAETYLLSKPLDGQLHHECTPIRLCPEYELYHVWFGVPKKYDADILHIIKESLRKKIPYFKIKSHLNICQNIH
jgi:hypothetical protein